MLWLRLREILANVCEPNKMCTLEKHGRLYLLTLTGAGDEHRLNPTLLDSMTAALSSIPSTPAPGTALITAAEGKFFSNGLDLSFARAAPSTHLPLLSSALRRTVAAFLSLPIPTLAAVSGHAAAAGVALVLCHDYVFMRSGRGFLYMSEVDLGLPIQPYFMELMRSKIRSPRSLKQMLLGGVRIDAAKGVEMGIVDRAVVGAEETVEAARRLGEELAGRNWDGAVYSSIRRAAFPEVFHVLSTSSDPTVQAMLERKKSSDPALKAMLESKMVLGARL